MENFVMNGDRVFISMSRQEYVDHHIEIIRKVKRDLFASKLKEQKKKWNRTAYENRKNKQNAQEQINTTESI